jgi:L-aminopeptidase/D-esterase-like protein
MASRMTRGVAKCVAIACLLLSPSSMAGTTQQNLKPVVNSSNRLLKFDWPSVEIGTGEYEEGPTGVTVFWFPHRALGAVDVRGGAPGTVNSDYIRLGYDLPEIDAVVFAGGSWYGLEAVTAVSSALKDDGIRSGDAFGAKPNIALSTGSIIFDFGPRRLNEIYPDKPLAQDAFRAARPGIFPLGAHGAGRFATTGSYFGCDAFSGQGGAFRQIGKIKIAAFTVVNAFGAPTTRDGKLAACYRDPKWPKDITVSQLVRNVPFSRKAGWGGPSARNTTVSLVIVNQKLTPVELQRLAVQVHTSMGRAIQPFSTEYDGDVLYAVSTGEVGGNDALWPPDLGVVASELMWDAVLDSVPQQPVAPPPNRLLTLSASQLQSYDGIYDFSQFVSVRITSQGGKLFAQATGTRDAYAIGRGQKTELLPVSANEFTVPGRYPLVLRFDPTGGLTINPGHWAQVGSRWKG